MPVVSFFSAGKALTINEVEQLSGVAYGGLKRELAFTGVSAISSAKTADITFASGAKQRGDFARLSGCLVFCTAALEAMVPADCFAFVTDNPGLAFNRVARAFYPESLRSPQFEGCVSNAIGAFVHPTARLEDNVTLSPGCVIGADVELGRGSQIGPYATLAAKTTIGRNCDIGAHSTVQCAHLGDNVTIGPNVSIGHDGFGFTPGPNGLEKVPQLGRVIIQSDVEIGAGTCIDRGSLDDTVIGEGTKIDNMVQVAHNVKIGRNCAIAAHAGISGSVTIGDGVLFGGRAGIADHLTVGAGAIIAAASGVMTDVPEGARYGGAPAKPLKEFFREIATLRALAAKDTKS
jgi:UDP-3-O-[3-hydroxymyristoyl] glucosamine N-acyltransferase